jgi:cephalosporin-C deacetylase-like acetyl esterase
MNIDMFKRLAVLTAVFGALIAWGGYTSEIALDRKDGIYRSGETAVCTVRLFKDGQPLAGEKVRLSTKWEGKLVKTEDIVADGKPMTVSYTTEQPGWVYFGVQVLGKDGKPVNANSSKSALMRRFKPTTAAEIGAMFDVEKIRYTVEPPADFDEFWAKRLAEVAAQELEPKLTELKSGVQGIKLFAVELSCPRGIKATGYLAYPENAAPKSLPACLSYLSWTNSDASRGGAIVNAKRGAVAFSATWHGLPVGKDAKYYEGILKKRVNGGMTGITDRDTWIMGEISFRVLCELKFLKSLPEWNGKDLISIGGSLGGAQSTTAAALDKDVTLALVNVPCFCEFDGAAVGRKGSIPRRSGSKTPEALKAQSYFDCAHLARTIKCDIFVCTGFADEGCPPSCVYAFYNAIPEGTNKVISTNPKTGHYGTTANVGGNARVEAFFKEAKIGAVPSEVR